PLTLSRNQSLGIPRFKANSDILREDLNDEEKEREKDKSLIYSANMSFSQNKTPRSKILAYTLKNTSLRGNVQKKQIVSPTSADTTTTYQFTHNYDLSIPKDKLDITLWGDYKYYFAPNDFSNTFSYNHSIPSRWMWETNNDSLDFWKPRPQTIETKILETDTSIRYDLFSDISLSYKLRTTRDLMQENTQISYIGQEKDRNQQIGLTYNPGYFDKLFTLNGSADVTYREDHKKISQTQEDEEDQYIYEGKVTRALSGSFRLKNKQIFTKWADKLARADTPEPPSQEDLEGRTGKPPQDSGKSGLPGTDPREAAENEREAMGGQNSMPREEKPKDLPEEEQTAKDSTAQGKNQYSEEQEKEKNNIRIFYWLVSYLSRLDNIRFDYNNNYSTNYEDRVERPSFEYQLGLPHILSEDEITVKTNNDKFSVSTAFLLLNNLNTTWNFSHQIDRTFGNTDKKSIKTIFPDVSATLSEFEKIIKAEDILTSSRLQSSYVVSKTQSGDFDWVRPQTEQTQITLRPLVSWNGNWANNITSNLAVNYSETENINHYDTYDIIKNETTQSITSNLSYSFSAERGISLPLLGKIRFKNNFTADLDFSLSKTYTTTKGNDKTSVDKDEIAYSITPGGSYDFSDNIYGGVNADYSWSHDRKKDLLIKTFELSIWVEVLF
ncbi:MAG: hypothetical protein SVM86_00540, partial [Candidatus Cloacimonadota bacterium]|nr:hypothetical protein [Candidatus Cloacimonadota bacterium]